MSEAGEDRERLNIYDAEGMVTGAMLRGDAKTSGKTVGVVYVLVANGTEVLLQKRQTGKENGGLWDKSVGGHVQAGEDFDDAAVRECREELFDGRAAQRVMLAANEADFSKRLSTIDLRKTMLLRRVSPKLQLNLRDVRRRTRREPRIALYHVAVYLGRTSIAKKRYRRQESEVAELDYFSPSAVDRMLLRKNLTPNMAFLWLTQAHALLG
jgi:hypothetical protein